MQKPNIMLSVPLLAALNASCLLLGVLSSTDAFIVSLPTTRHRGSSSQTTRETAVGIPTRKTTGVFPLGSHSSDLDDSEEEELPPIDVRMFLTQCCIQSFMFLLVSMRDVHTMKYLDDYTQAVFDDDDDDDGSPEEEEGSPNTWVDNDKKLSSRLLQYHGVCAMDTTRFPTWDSYFVELVRLPCTTLTIQSAHYPEFDIDIDPSRLCGRMISVREQIAKEWNRDLEVIGNVGHDIFYSYWETVKERREKQQTLAANDDNNNNNEPAGDEESGRAFERHDKYFLEWDPFFDEGAAPSPFRKGNFDLLYNLATQESIHRVLLEDGISVEQDEDGEASTAFLHRFYRERIESHFRGDLRYGRADDFLEELMLCTPKIVASPQKDDDMVIVNPVTIAEVVLKTREKVVKDWQEIAKNVPREHTDIRKLILNSSFS